MLSMKLSVADSKRMNVAINALAKENGKELLEVLKSEIRLFAADLAQNTKPEGKDKDAQQRGMANVEGRIRQIYLTSPIVSVIIEKQGLGVGTRKHGQAKFAALMESKKYKEVQKYLDSVVPFLNITVGKFDKGELHKAQRKQARVTKRMLVVTGVAGLGVYIRREQKKVGFAKSGFATAARYLGGTRGIPGWVTRLKGAGWGRVYGTNEKPNVELGNRTRYIRQALDKRGENRAISFRTRSIEGRVFKAIDYNARKATRKINS